MNIFVYSDESGTFDRKHNNTFVFGGLIFLSKDDKDINTRKFIKAEKDISGYYNPNTELKASILKNKDKGKLYRSLNQCVKFGAIVNQNKIHSEIFHHKKNKQRYLDYAFKIALKRAFCELIERGLINCKSVENIYVFVDEHSTATDGRYELKEGLEQEYKIGTFNYGYNTFYPPIFANLSGITLKYCNSESVHLIRASDIVANRIYYCANNDSLPNNPNLIITRFP